MKSDAISILGESGNIIHKVENAKFGGAQLSYTIENDLHDAAFLDLLQERLVDRGWKRVNGQTISYCKEGILAKIEPNSEVMDGKLTRYIGMTYNAATIIQCEKQ